ncbi:Alcohol acetyltransferase [Ophidiomyces ophidiicola]|nr:Alcohol acetyltransferase [Ophidiomyces ophidiicola]
MATVVGSSAALLKLEKLRSAGPLEKYSNARHHLGYYYNVAVSAVYKIPHSLSRPLREYVYQATEKLIGQHPILSAVPVGEDTNDPYFVRLPAVDLEQSIFFHDWSDASPGSTDKCDQEGNVGSGDSNLDLFLETEHNTPFVNWLPFWRLHIISTSTTEQDFIAVFVYHHSIGDGSSGTAFHSTFLGAFTDALAVNSGEPKTIIQSPSLPLLPSLESIHPFPVSIFYILKAIFYTKIWNRPDPELWAGGKISLPLKNKVHHITLSKSDSAALRKSCRDQGTTITGAIQTLLARALFICLPIEFTKLSCTSAISIRRWLSSDIITSDSIGVWVMDYADLYKRNHVAQPPSFPWDEARRSRKTIEETLSRRGRDTKVGLLRFVRDVPGELLTCMIGRERSVSFEISNLGAFKPSVKHLQPSQTTETEPEINENDRSNVPQIGKVVFSQSASVTGSAVNLSVVTGSDGCMVLTFSWQEGIVDPQLVASVAMEMKKEIDLLISQQKKKDNPTTV